MTENISMRLVSRLQAWRPGIDSRLEQEFFYTPASPCQLWNPPSLISNGYRGYFSGPKEPGRGPDRSHPFCAEVKIIHEAIALPHDFHGAALN
jgi:hypothetical protein